MSAGSFESAKYEQSTGGNIWPCRAQTETKELAIGGETNDYPAGAVTAGLPKVKLRKGRREFGLPVRTVTVKLTAAGTGATAEYLSGTLHRVPCFTQAFYDDLVDGATGTYLGIACEVVDKSTND
jgi:hypothetical protein